MNVKPTAERDLQTPREGLRSARPDLAGQYGGSSIVIAYLLAALALAMLFAGRTMAPAFGPSMVVADDMRQYIVWVARLKDPELFRDDPIADYYQAISPPGYSALFWLLGRAMEPLLAAKLLPVILGLLTALFVFKLVRALHPAPAAAFLATVLHSWYTWQYEDLASATPRAFLVPLLPALLWALAARRLLLAVALVGLAALFYPFGAALGAGLLGLRLIEFRCWRPRLARNRAGWAAFLASSLLAGVLLLPGQVAVSRFGPLVSGAQARAMPEFSLKGRHPFFADDPYVYWVAGRDSGLDLKITDPLLGNIPLLFEYAAVAGLLPALWALRRRLPVAQHLRTPTMLLAWLVLASSAFFLLAHLLLFQLYFPSRYVRWSLPLALAVGAGLALGILFEAAATRVAPSRRKLVVAGLVAGLATALALYPARHDGQLRGDRRPAISAYLRAQPKNVLVAAPAADADSIPAFAERRAFAVREQALPFHLGFYGRMKERAHALIEAYYAESPGEVADFAERHGINFFLVNRSAFQPASFALPWSGSSSGRWEPYISGIAPKLEMRRQFALLALTPRCAVVDDGQIALVPATCLRATL